MDFYENMTIYTAQDINDEFSHNIMPVSAVVSLFALTGILGNLFVLYVHIFKYQSCNFRYFVLALCAVDLTASLTILPMEVFTQLHWYVFPSSVLCKLKSFLHLFLSVSTVYILLLIAIDRHRKVCFPYSWQVTSRTILKGYVICFVMTGLQSWTVVMMFDKRQVQKEYRNTSVTVHTCTSDPTRTIWRYIYIGAIVPYFLAMAVMLVLYCLVGHQVFGYVMKMRQKSQFRKRSNTVGNKTLLKRSPGECNAKGITPDTISDDELHSSSIIDDNLCKEVNDTTQTTNALELVAYRVQENGIMFEKGSSVKRKGSDAIRVKMTFEEKKRMEERSTNNRVSRIPDDDLSRSHFSSSKVCSTSESETDRVKEESTISSSSQSKQAANDPPQKAKVVKHVSLAARLTTRVKDLGQKTVVRTKKKVTFSGKARNKLRRRTLITFVFTFIFIITTIIYLVISGKVFREHQMSYSELSLYLFFYRLYFINSVIHPIIYGVLDPKFRKTLQQTTKHVIESVRSRHD